MSALKFLVFLFPVLVMAEEFKVPVMTSPVVDQVGLLTGSQRADIENSIFTFKEQRQAQIQVLIVPDLQGDSIESVAIKVFDQWKLGDAKRDDGLLLLISVQDKKMRIEVGQGLEGSVPDVIAKRIISEVIRPFFQRQEFYQGIKVGILAIEGAIVDDPASAQNYKDAAKNPTVKKSRNLNIYVIGFIFFIWLIIFLVSPSTGINILTAVLFSSRSRGNSGWGGGSGGGWGGSGGGSSGGGASGDW